MISTGREDISRWASQIDTIIANTEQCCVNRVVVVESTPSTMDAAAQFGDDDGGVLVVASEQTQGRGQRGRQWHDSDRRTLPCTFVIDSNGLNRCTLAAIVGCAVHETIRSITPRSTQVMIKWPNDVVIRTDANDQKIAGILIEQQGSRTLIGIGINCIQGRSDWDQGIRDHAVSLSEIGVQVSRLDLMCGLVEHLSHWLNERSESVIKDYYESFDAMIHTRRSFVFDRQQFEGIVEMIDPLECIVVRTSTGTHRLPIAQTGHLRADA